MGLGAVAGGAVLGSAGRPSFLGLGCPRDWQRFPVLWAWGGQKGLSASASPCPIDLLSDSSTESSTEVCECSMNKTVSSSRANGLRPGSRRNGWGGRPCVACGLLCHRPVWSRSEG